ncbi:MAG TPA: hypothetical protein VIJ41_07655 [Candidatus Nanopelagicales bacterium]
MSVFRPDVDLQVVRTLLMEVAQAKFPFCLHARPALRGALGTVADEMGMVPVDDVPLMVLDDPTALRVATQVDELSVRVLTEDEHSVHEELLSAG